MSLGGVSEGVYKHTSVKGGKPTLHECMACILSMPMIGGSYDLMSQAFGAVFVGLFDRHPNNVLLPYFHF